MKKKILNKAEKLTKDRLEELCSRDEVNIHPKLGLSDVFTIEKSGISDREYSYALKAHFDFTISDKEYNPLFSVEYDGPYHESDEKQKQNDKLKNKLCDHFNHPLLCINSNYLSKKYRQLDLLKYFIDAWFQGEAFYKAKEAGTVPPDEPFMLTSVISDGNNMWPYLLSLDAQQVFRKNYEAGKILMPATSFWVGCDEEGNYHCITWIEVKKEQYLFVTTGMQKQYFPYVYSSDLLNMIAKVELAKKLNGYFSDNVQLVAKQHLERKVSTYQDQLKLATMGGLGSEIWGTHKPFE